MGLEESEFCHATVVNLRTDKGNQNKRLLTKAIRLSEGGNVHCCWRAEPPLATKDLSEDTL
jgi:hypothetical protein